MAERLVSQLKPGERLIRPVYTPLGSQLFPKGTVIREREQEILQAFMIHSVETSGDVQTSEQLERSESVFSEETSLYLEYDHLLHYLKKTLPQAAVGPSPMLPLLSIRKRLRRLLDFIDQYDILTFRPAKMPIRDYFYHNSIMVSMTSYLLAQWSGSDHKDHFPIALAGLLHNIGYMKLNQDLLRKKSLTKHEQEQLQKHPVHGYRILQSIPGLNHGIKMAALQHHEKVDGSGYPLGLKGDNIHPYAKVVAVADIYHAMTNKRNYKEASSPYAVLDQLFAESFGQLDPLLVQAFIHKITQYHNGMLVKLSDESIGEIVFTDRTHPTRPWVKVGDAIINLVEDRSLHIVEVMKK